MNSAPSHQEKLSRADINQNTVLVVEDDDFLGGLLRQKFQEENFVVHHAADAKQAHSALKKNRIDVICLDITLPGASGLALLEEIKSDDRFKAVPVLIVTNLGKQEEIEKGIKAGAADYVIKAGVSTDEIVQKAKALIKG